MVFKLKINCANDAFSDDVCIEIARILRKTADGLESLKDTGPLMDYNGNKVGEFSLSEGE